MWSLIKPCWLDFFGKINRRVDMIIRTSRVVRFQGFQIFRCEFEKCFRVSKKKSPVSCFPPNNQVVLSLGGDWTVAFAIFSRAQRDIIRKALGNEVIFLILHLSDECNKKRLHR